MKTKIIKIGNSQGVRIPKPILKQTGIQVDLELEVEKGRIILRPISNPRTDWDIAFKEMAENKDDRVIDGADGIRNSFDEEEWQW